MGRRSICAQMMTLCLLLTACGAGSGSGGDDQLALDIRAEYIGMESCTAQMALTADYGQRVYEYTMDMSVQKDGEMVLTVLTPGEIAGVTARVRDGKTSLSYDGASLETGALDPQGLSPVSAVPALLSYARAGFIAECGTETVGEINCLRVCYRTPESEPGTGTEAVLWFDSTTHALVQGEILVAGRRAIQCTFTSFSMTKTPEGTAHDNAALPTILEE